MIPIRGGHPPASGASAPCLFGQSPAAAHPAAFTGTPRCPGRRDPAPPDPRRRLTGSTPEYHVRPPASAPRAGPGDGETRRRKQRALIRTARRAARIQPPDPRTPRTIVLAVLASPCRYPRCDLACCDACRAAGSAHPADQFAVRLRQAAAAAGAVVAVAVGAIAVAAAAARLAPPARRPGPGRRRPRWPPASLASTMPPVTRIRRVTLPLAAGHVAPGRRHVAPARGRRRPQPGTRPRRGGTRPRRRQHHQRTPPALTQLARHHRSSRRAPRAGGALAPAQRLLPAPLAGGQATLPIPPARAANARLITGQALRRTHGHPLSGHRGRHRHAGIHPGKPELRRP